MRTWLGVLIVFGLGIVFVFVLYLGGLWWSFRWKAYQREMRASLDGPL